MLQQLKLHRRHSQRDLAIKEKEHIDPVALRRGLQQTIQNDMNKFAAEQALNANDASYKKISRLYCSPEYS
jgi:hypothetical protein